MQSKKYRVVTLGTGQVSYAAIPIILDHLDLELVGLGVHSQEKEGLDAGVFCGREPLGIRGTRDIESLLALNPECVLYFFTDIGRPKDAVEDVCQILAAGKNVITPNIVLGFASGPNAIPMGFSVAEKVAEACTEGNSTFFATGINPDSQVVMMATLASFSQDIQSVSMAEMYPIEAYEDRRIWAGVGIGLPPGDPVPECLTFFEQYLTPHMHFIAHTLGAEIDEFRHSHKVALADKAMDFPGYHVPEGSVSAMWHSIEGVIGGVPRIVEHGVYWVGKYPHDWLAPPPGIGGYRLHIAGTPDMSMCYEYTQPGQHPIISGLTATAPRPVNAIPVVSDAKPGIKTFLDLPYILPKVSWRNRVGTES